jgi:hypothetical protein
VQFLAVQENLIVTVESFLVYSALAQGKSHSFATPEEIPAHLCPYPGWTITIQDYEGPNAAFIAGRLEGRGVLDGIRATLNFPKLGLSNPKLAIWVCYNHPIFDSSPLAHLFLCRVIPEVVPLLVGVSSEACRFVAHRLTLLDPFSTAAALQPSYAPELNLIGVAQGGTPANLTATADFIVSLTFLLLLPTCF